jgi:perosamine synthetase
MYPTKIQITQPSISDLEISYVNDAIRNGWGPKCYEYIYKFENLFSAYIGTPYGLATSSCTGAIHLALMALGVQRGDEVIVPESTWIASVEPVLYIGAKPVFVDVKPDTWCIDPLSVEKAITRRTKAIIVVHLYGNVAEMDEIMEIARRHDLKVLEDAAEGLGSEYKGKKAGSIGHAGVFSFHGTKTLSTGEGGMVVTHDQDLIEKIRILNDHGRDPKDGKTFWMRDYGYKYKMSNLQAAMGCAQTERISELIDKKRTIFEWYKKYLNSYADLTLNAEQAYVKNSYWMPTLAYARRANVDRDDLLKFLKTQNIDARPFFYPLSSLPMFESIQSNRCAYDIYDRALNLPSHHNLTEQEVKYVSETILFYLKNKG